MRRIPASTWAEIRTAYASGIGLREIARNMGIPAGTVLARSKREGWTRQIATAKLIERPELARELAKPDAIDAITPMPPGEILVHARNVEQFDRFSRRNLGLDNQPTGNGPLTLAVLANHTAIQIVNKTD